MTKNNKSENEKENNEDNAIQSKKIRQTELFFNKFEQKYWNLEQFPDINIIGTIKFFDDICEKLKKIWFKYKH